MYGIVENPGLDSEDLVVTFDTWAEALRYKQDHYHREDDVTVDIVKVVSSEEWTTEF